MGNAGSVGIKCPECKLVIEVALTAELTEKEGRQYLSVEPDMSDLWAHSWSHEE